MLFRRLQTEDEQLDRIQQAVETAFTALERSPLFGAIVVGPFALTTAFKNFEHPLGRAPTYGAMPFDLDADTRVWRDPTASNNPDPSKFLRLRASAAVNARFLVF